MDPIGSKPLRKYIHEMARQYGITSNSTGQGENRFITLTRSKKCHFTTQRKVDLIINNYVEEEGKQKIKRNERQQQKQGGMGGKNSHAFVKPAIGTVVGQHVAPIGSTNIGHQLLAKMGWSSGQALGSTGDGITAPIEAMVRSKREGLGS
ncbi:G-patch-domain-containing protein [Ramicandelaber brevisporus]|nr:G-patch-domain-containing protein [Ramicandelaber brevisporus]